jgi:hypothetical protein
MTTGEAVADDKPCPHTTVLRFKLDAMQARVEQIRLKAAEVSQAAMRAVKAAMQSMGMRDPERGPADYDDFADERRFYQRLLRERNGGHGSVTGGGNTNKWILGIVGVLIAGGIFGLTSALFTMTDRISKVETKVDMLIKDRK